MTGQLSSNTLYKYYEKVEIILQAIAENYIDVNDWELEFIDSLDRRIEKNEEYQLSYKQCKVINQLYNRIE